jgi:4-carboxymuconolactone decarboxylase
MSLYSINHHRISLEGGFNMSKDLKELTRKTASLYFDGLEGEKPYEIWRSFDPQLARDLSLFVTGQLYARERIPHNIRQLVTVAALTVLGRTEELGMHIHAALNVGCGAREIAEVIFQMVPYGGVPIVNSSLKTLRNVLQQRGSWPINLENKKEKLPGEI